MCFWQGGGILYSAMYLLNKYYKYLEYYAE